MTDGEKESDQPSELKGTTRGAFRFSRPCVRSALFAFFLSRIIVAAIVVLTANVVFQPVVHSVFGDLHESNIRLANQGIVAPLRQITLAADSAWIMNIAINGYEKEPFNNATQHTWAYFPLYPLLLRGAAKLTGEFPLTGMALSNLFFLLALIMLYQTALEFGCDKAAADRTVFYLALFPVSYFFSLAQTESLFLLLTVASIYCAKKRAWWLAGVCGALASATRFAGVFLLVPLCVIYWQHYRAIAKGAEQSSGIAARLRGLIKPNALALLVVPLGLLAFMLYLRSITGNAFAFSDIQVAWGHSPGFFWRPLLTYLGDPLQVSAGWDFRLLNFAAATTALVCSVVLLMRREWALGSFALLSIIVPMSYQPLLQSFARYVMVIFPVFFVLATAGRRPRVDQVIRAVFIGLLCLMTALLAARVTLSFA
jgi:hypothetical protein